MMREIGVFLIGVLVGIVLMLIVFMMLFSTFMQCVYEQAEELLRQWLSLACYGSSLQGLL
jgi:hypothetical protein